MFYSDGQVTVWRKLGTGFLKKNLTPTVKFGKGSTIAHGDWCSLMKKWITHYTICKYISEQFSEIAGIMGMEKDIFQQNNDLKYISMLAKAFFED